MKDDLAYYENGNDEQVGNLCTAELNHDHEEYKMNDMLTLQQIRKSERISHIKIYSTKELYEEGSWLSKPVKTCLDLIPLFENYRELNILDLGCGVGRNSIPFAHHFNHISCCIDCVDILDLAIKKLNENARKYAVSSLKGIVMPIEEYLIKENHYDLIMAISALEHINSKEAFVNKLWQIKKGIRERGIICLVISTNISETDKITRKNLPVHYEVNLSSNELQEYFNQIFQGWEIIKSAVSYQQYDIPREYEIRELKANVITYVARKPSSSHS